MSSSTRAVLSCLWIGAAACFPTVIVVQDTAGLHTGDTGVARAARDTVMSDERAGSRDSGAVFDEGSLGGQSMP